MIGQRRGRDWTTICYLWLVMRKTDTVQQRW